MKSFRFILEKNKMAQSQKTDDFTRDFYENVRDSYSEEIEKEYRNSTTKNHYIQAMTFAFKNHDPKYVILDPKEALRFAFFLEDQFQTDNYDYGEELDKNYKRNPDFFSRYFRVVKEEKEGEIIPAETDDKENNVINMNVAQESSLEEIAPVDGDIWTKTMEILPESFSMDGIIIENEETNLEESYEEINLEESKAITEAEAEASLDQAIIEVTTEISKARQQDLVKSLKELLVRATKLKIVDKNDVLVALGETVTLRRIIISMFAKLGVQVSSTQLIGTQLKDKVVNFVEAPSDISLDDLKYGLTKAHVKIDELVKQGEEFNKVEAKRKEFETKIKSVSQEIGLVSSKNKELELELSKEVRKPKIADSKNLYCYIAWDDDGTRYYLSSEEEPNDAGLYRTNSLMKKKKKTNAIKFTDNSIALVQIERSIKYYNKINTKEKISLEHLRNAYLVSILEYSDKSRLKKTIVRES
jgi:hypothetical protein